MTNETFAPLTEEHRRRTIEALKETKELLKKETHYQPRLWNINLIDSYRKHIAKLEAMLAA